MNIPNIGGIVKVGKTFLMAKRPEIMLGTSVVAAISAAVLGAKGGWEARGIVEQRELELGRQTDVKEKIQLTWMNYLPSAGLAGAAIGSTAGLHIVHVKEKKALAAAALMAIEEVKTEAKQYSDQLVEAVEKNTTPKTQQKIADDAIDPNGDGIADHLQNTNHEVEELYLVRDGKTGRDIWSNERRIDEAVNTVNKWIASQGDCDLNSFYSNAGYEVLPDGDDWGWSGELVELTWDEVKRDDGRPVRRFAFRSKPSKGYDRPVR